MSTFADHLRAQEQDRKVREDPLTWIVREIADCDLPTDTKAAIIKHIEDARAKHPYKPKPDKPDSAPAIPDTRPSSLSAVADAIDALTKKDTKTT